MGATGGEGGVHFSNGLVVGLMPCGRKGRGGAPYSYFWVCHATWPRRRSVCEYGALLEP
jgi:hypothetical protein